MSPVCPDELTDELLSACLAYDAKGVHRALEKGALVNRENRAGLIPVHVLIDPGATHKDKCQAKCLKEMLAHRVNLIAKHRGTYSVYERVSTYLPACANVLIDHHKGLPPAVRDMEMDERLWWEDLARKWYAKEEAKALDENTARAGGGSDARRL